MILPCKEAEDGIDLCEDKGNTEIYIYIYIYIYIIEFATTRQNFGCTSMQDRGLLDSGSCTVLYDPTRKEK
jgi:hypothetical protein